MAFHTYSKEELLLALAKKTTKIARSDKQTEAPTDIPHRYGPIYRRRDTPCILNSLTSVGGNLQRAYCRIPALIEVLFGIRPK